MNESGVVQAVYDTINDNKPSLVEGLEANGLACEISCLTDTLTQPPTEYYAIAAHCKSAVEHNSPDARNTMLASPYVTMYDIEILVADQVLPDPGDDRFGETATNNFRVFCDRIVKLFRRDQTWYPNASASPRYRLYLDPARGRVVDKRNDPPDTDGTNLFLSAAISFRLTGCND